MLNHLFVNFRLLCENMKASKPIAIMFCLEYVMKENRLKTRQFERVCVCDSVSIHAFTHAQVQGLYVCKHNMLLNTSCFSYFHSSPFTFNSRPFLTSVTLCNFVQNKKN